jgi:hypothetical protein
MHVSIFNERKFTAIKLVPKPYQDGFCPRCLSGPAPAQKGRSG